MKIQSNIPIPDTLQWKGEQMLIAVNHRENPVTSEEGEGSRYEADFTVADTSNEADIISAVHRMLHDSAHDDNVIHNFSKEKKTYDESLPQINSQTLIFDKGFEKTSETISAKNNDADGNIKKLTGNIKNYVADLTDGVRTPATDADVDLLIAAGNILITNE